MRTRSEIAIEADLVCDSRRCVHARPTAWRPVEDGVVPSPGGRVVTASPLSRRGGLQEVVRARMEAAERRAGLPVKGRVHILRHTFCSHLAMQGAPAKAIQELAGHTTLTITARYMHLSPAAKDAAIKLLDRRPAGDGVEAGDPI